MTNQNEPDTEKSDMRAMWIMTAVIVLLILGGMGLNMIFNPDTGTGPSDISSQSRTATPK